MCVEKGEWPVNHRNSMPAFQGGDSRSSTPIPGTPPTLSVTPSYTPSHSIVAGLDFSVASAVSSVERLSESLAMAQKRRHRRTKAEMEADRGQWVYLCLWNAEGYGTVRII